MTEYAELHCHSYFSLLDGASSPEELVARAAELGLRALALTDHDSLAGAVRFWTAARHAGLHAIAGAEVTLEDGHHLTLLAETQTGYANLCRLITAARLEGDKATSRQGDRETGRQGAATITQSPDHPITQLPCLSPWPGKVPPSLRWARLAEHRQGLIVLTGCRRGPVAGPLLRQAPEAAEAAIRRLQAIFDPGQLYVEVQHHALADDDWLVRRLLALARRSGLPAVATHNVHYATAERAMLRDALIAIRHNETHSAARRAGRLPLNRNYALAAPAKMAHCFHAWPEVLRRTLEIGERCQAKIDFSDRRLPVFEFPETQMNADERRFEQEMGRGKDGSTAAFSASHSIRVHPRPSAFQFLYDLCHASLPRRYPDLRPLVLKQLAHELEVIEQAGLAGYFLIVWDIVRFAREQGIRCQGRGSAASSIVAYLLEITSVDPLRHNLLFERFLSADRYTMPDIDIDFAADRREEVIQYVYARYGQAHAAMVCNVVTFQAHSAIRALGKVLELGDAPVERLLGMLDTNSAMAAAEQIERETKRQGEKESGSPVDHPITQSPNHPVSLPILLRQIDGCPRHLSIHSGGMLITGPRLDEVAPLEPATMPGRVICQWDKESVEDAGLIKIDLLALRTLGLISAAVAYIAEMRARGDRRVQLVDLSAIPFDDPAIYQMLQRGDTIGAFQVESRAQQQMLPRLKPERFEDITIEVAIVRPGPIQGGAVHPYLRRRAGLEPVTYRHPSLEPVLAETLGVLLFQEQAIRVAVAAAGFTPSEADMLRRALSHNRSQAAMAALQTRFLQGAAAQGIDAATAQEIFRQLAGFAGYGFCKSHAASFARIAYETLWLKQYHAPAFYCALLNAQPMGFYAPEVIVGDARRHGVETLPPDLNRSDWGYTLEYIDSRRWALRTGLSTIAELGEQGWARIEAVRREQRFEGLADFCRRTRLAQDVVRNLIRAGACDAFGPRRTLLWQLGELDYRPGALDLPAAGTEVELPALAEYEATAWEYELMGLAPARQLMVHHRVALRKAGIAAVWQVKELEAGQRARVAGYIVVRQRPATAKGILFMSLEDESGLLDLVVKPEVYTEYREVIRQHALLVAEGVVQRSGRVVSLLVRRVVGLQRLCKY